MSERLPMVAYGVSAGDVEQLDHICVIAKGEDAHVIKVLREEVFGPKDGIVVRPCSFAVTSETVDEHDTKMGVRCILVVRLGAYSTVSVAPSATVLSLYAPAVENNSSGGSSVCLSLAGPLFFFPLVLRRRNIPSSSISTAFEAMRNRL